MENLKGTHYIRMISNGKMEEWKGLGQGKMIGKMRKEIVMQMKEIKEGKGNEGRKKVVKERMNEENIWRKNKKGR